MNMADAVLGEQARKEYDGCLSYITDCYTRMSTNRDAAYRVQQLQLVDKMLERMTVLLETMAR